MEVVDGVYTRWFGNEDEYAWLGLNQATDEALPEYDQQGQTDIMDGDKGGRKANECRKLRFLRIITIDLRTSKPIVERLGVNYTRWPLMLTK